MSRPAERLRAQIAEVQHQIAELHDQIEESVARRREELRYRIENGRIVWEEGVRRHHRALRVRLSTFLARTRLRYVITAPVIYALIVPFALLDLFVTLYQAICFPAYGIPKVTRRDYIRIDRHHLAYLNGLQKLNCAYCGYCNGLLAYVTEIAGRTEAFWCPIKHAARVRARHRHYDGFLDYGDAEGFEDGVKAQRDRIREV
ncbi:hypothetical protein [Pseudooceanicola nanhaiensis]|uniref:hypothetical protein n=1 Tax=Pseudooceanicola nanhaiensis TaxID=375761 RepID=UPI001CD682DB|nr:hypothetical protein [Pseudooceanicola nanhaiensis]MCA0922446.1 hypothetical protein [Pseudooceanicola nanhaiensis]